MSKKLLDFICATDTPRGEPGW